MATKNEGQNPAVAVVVAAEPLIEPAKAAPAAAPAATAAAKVEKVKAPAGKATATPAAAAKKPAAKAAPAKRAPAKAKPVNAKVQASQAALAKALATAQAVKLTPRPAAKVEKAEKTGKAAKPVKAEKPVKSEKPAKAERGKKVQLVRDSFTMPENEYAVIATLKKRLQGAGAAAKKSELLRAGIALLANMKDAELVAALARVEKIKTGRPAKAGK